MLYLSLIGAQAWELAFNADAQLTLGNGK